MAGPKTFSSKKGVGVFLSKANMCSMFANVLDEELSIIASSMKTRPAAAAYTSGLLSILAFQLGVI